MTIPRSPVREIVRTPLERAHGAATNLAVIQWLHNGSTSPDSLTTGPLWVPDHEGTLVSAGADALAIPGMRLAEGAFVNDDGAGNALYPSQKVKTVQGVETFYTGDYKGMMVQPARTNLFTAPGAPVTQDITTTAQDYAISVYGTGSVTLSGTATGTINAGEELKITATAGTLTVTVTGTPDHVQVEAGAFATPPIGYGETAAATHTRAATVASFNSAGRIRAQNCVVWGRVVPGFTPTGAVTNDLFSSYSDVDNDLKVLTYNGTVRLAKRIAGTNSDANSLFTPTGDTPFEYQGLWSDQGTAIRIKEDGGTWGAWATNTNTAPAPVTDTIQIGSRAGANQFAGTYPFTTTTCLPTQASLADYQNWIETNTQWNVLGVSA